jgi:hypothetical protein
MSSLKARLPADHEVVHAVRVAVSDTSTVRLRPDEPAPAGTRYVEFVKTLDPKTDHYGLQAFDETGESIDGDAVVAEVEQARRKKFGKLESALHDRLEKLQPGDKIDVVVWPTIDDTDVNFERVHGDYDGGDAAAAADTEDDLARPSAEAIAQQTSFCQHVLTGKQSVTHHLTDCHATLRDDDDGESDLPFVRATMTVEQVKELADYDKVGGIFFDDSDMVPDLAESLAIAKADLAQTPGRGGQGVNVAVWEFGPKDLTNLSVAGRYAATLAEDPSSPGHARLTAGIIKNVEPGKPHGYAPNCTLWLANSYSRAAAEWAVKATATKPACTVISSSFGSRAATMTGDMDADSIYLDYLTQLAPRPLIVRSAGNFRPTATPPADFVKPKGFNYLAVGSHDDLAAAMAASSSFRNPRSPHGDRELPDICANGTGVSVLGLSKSGTSFATPAVAGTAALMQAANAFLRGRPEACRAALYASANRNVAGGTWASDMVFRRDGRDGSGALNALAAVEIARAQTSSASAPAPRGVDFVPLLRAGSFATGTGLASFRHRVSVARAGVVVRAAIAWSSVVGTFNAGSLQSRLVHDLDLFVVGPTGATVARSASFDNSYEVVEFVAGEAGVYVIQVRLARSTDNNSPTALGIAWTQFE